MILKSLHLKNIRSYVEETLEFPKGSILLAGDIGSGKSTILMAIEFALFGIQKGSLNGQTLLRLGETRGTVTLQFEVHDRTITISRGIKRTNESVIQIAGFMIEDDIKTEGTPVELKARILELLGYPSEFLTKKNLIYRYTVYTPQEEMRKVLFEDKDLRLDILRKIFAFDKYKRIKDNAALYLKKLRMDIRTFEGFLLDYEEKKKGFEHLEVQLLDLRNQVEIKTPRLVTSKEETKKAKGEYDEQNMLVQKKKEYQKQIELALQKEEQIKNQQEEQKKRRERYEVLIQTLEKEIALLPPIDEKLDDKIRDKQEQIATFQKQKQDLEQQHALQVQEQDRLQKECEEYDQLIALIKRTEQLVTSFTKNPELGKKKEEKEKQKLQLEKDIQEFELKIKSANALMESIGKIDHCPTCKQEVGEVYKHEIAERETTNITAWSQDLEIRRLERDAYIGAIVELEKKLAEEEEIEKTIMLKKGELKNLDDKRVLLEAKKIKLSACTEELNKIKAMQNDQQKVSVVKIEEELSKLREQEKIAIQKKHLEEQKKTRREELATMHEQQKQNQEEQIILNTRKETIKKTLDEIGNPEEKINALEKRFEEALQKERLYEIDLAKTKTEYESLVKQKASPQKELAQKENTLQKKQYTQKLASWLDEHFLKMVGEIEKHVLSRIYMEFNDVFQNWFGTLIEGEVLQARLDDEFTPVVEQNGYETDPSDLSGGEKTALALAYRLSMNKVINDMSSHINTSDIIILDEPTDGFSQTQLDRVREVLDDLDIPQVIIVSHENKIESFVENTLRIVKNEHVSSVL